MQAQGCSSEGKGSSSILCPFLGQFNSLRSNLQYIDPIIAATYSEDGAIHDVCRALALRLREPNVIVSYLELNTAGWKLSKLLGCVQGTHRLAHNDPERCNG